MMDALRSSAGSWIAKVFIGLLALSFGIWGIADVFRVSTSDELATVGTQKISENEYRRAFDREVRALGERQGVTLTPDQARALGLDRQVLAQLLQGASLNDQARQLGLTVSDDFIAARIAANKAFQNSSGQFDPLKFRQLMAANNLTEQEVVVSERDSVLGNGIVDAIADGTEMPKTMSQIAWRHRNEQRDAKYFTLTSEKITIPQPSDSELKSFYDQNPRSFMVPERRTVAVLPVTPDTVASSIVLTDDELRKAYDSRKDQYEVPETRRVEQIAFPSVEAAEAARAKIMQGTSFAQIGTERGFSEKDIALGKVSKVEMRDADAANAAFALKDGEVSQPVRGKLSVYLVRASELTPGRQKSFDEVKETLRKDLQLERARDAIIELHGKIEDGRGGGATLEEIARENQLALKVLGAMDANGAGTDGKDVGDIPAKPELLKAAFESDVGMDSEPLTTKDDGFIWYEVREVKPAARKPLNDARQEVIEAWTASKRRDQLLDQAKALQKRGEQGAKLEDLAREVGSEVKTQTGIKRGQSSEPFDSNAVSALFAVPESGFAVAIEGDGKSARIMQSSPVMLQPFNGNSPEVRQISELLSKSLSGDITSLYLGELQQLLGVTINEERWQQTQGNRS